jgi:hypothetical protein
LNVGLSAVLMLKFLFTIIVPDPGSWDRDVVLVQPGVCWGNPRGVGNLEWGGDGEGMRKGRSVYEQPGTKVDRVASRQRRVSK